MYSDLHKTYYVGFWLRVLGYFIDAMVLWVLSILIGILCGIMMNIADVKSLTLPFMIGTLISQCYEPLFLGSRLMATPGKMAIGAIVIDEQGKRLSYMRAYGRLWAKYLSALTLCIGFMMIGFTRKKQGLHDMVAKTVVVKKPLEISA